jgi:hypothetical protein
MSLSLKFIFQVVNSSNVGRSYDFVDERFFEMWKNYATFGKNCGDWARDFYNKLT